MSVSVIQSSVASLDDNTHYSKRIGRVQDHIIHKDVAFLPPIGKDYNADTDKYGSRMSRIYGFIFQCSHGI